jgi:hypothetical protein
MRGSVTSLSIFVRFAPKTTKLFDPGYFNFPNIQIKITPFSPRSQYTRYKTAQQESWAVLI